jgi:hypothetical protein
MANPKEYRIKFKFQDKLYVTTIEGRSEYEATINFWKFIQYKTTIDKLEEIEKPKDKNEPPEIFNQIFGTK